MSIRLRLSVLLMCSCPWTLDRTCPWTARLTACGVVTGAMVALPLQEVSGVGVGIGGVGVGGVGVGGVGVGVSATDSGVSGEAGEGVWCTLSTATLLLIGT